MTDQLTGISRGILKFKVIRDTPVEVLRGLNGLIAKTKRQLVNINVIDLSVEREDDVYVAYVHIEKVEEYA